MHEPDLLVLDEPTSGLDPLVQETFYELVAEATGRGGTVFLSSHVLSEVQHMADRVGADPRRAGSTSSTASRTFAPARSRTWRRRLPSLLRLTHSPWCRACSGLDHDGPVVRFALEGEIDALLKALARFHVKALDVREADLEDVFLARYRGEEPDAP